jgi:hypothetical protein
MHIRSSLNLGTLIALIVVFYFAYELLLCDNFLHLSIGSIVGWAHHQSTQIHLVILGFIPVYLGAVIFGAATLSLYIGAYLQSWLNRLFFKVNVETK